MMEKVCLIAKKFLLFSLVCVVSFFTIALVLGFTNIMGKSDAVDTVAVFSMLILPIVSGFVVVRKKYPKAKKSGQGEQTSTDHNTDGNLSDETKSVHVLNPTHDVKPDVSTNVNATQTSFGVPVKKTYRVAGTSFYMDNLKTLAYENPDYEKTKQELIDEGRIDEKICKYEFYPAGASLVPEPDNPHDKNAIQVIVDGLLVGYIKAGSCAHLLKVINGDRIRGIECDIYGGPFKMVTEDYDSENEYEETYTLEQEDRNFSVILQVYEEPVKK